MEMDAAVKNKSHKFSNFSFLSEHKILLCQCMEIVATLVLMISIPITKGSHQESVLSLKQQTEQNIELNFY